MVFRSVLLGLFAFCASTQTASCDVITQWNFNSNPADNSVATGSLVSNIGTGTISLMGGVSSLYANANSDNGSTDPVTTDDTGLQTSAYPSRTTNSRTAGVQFLSGTLGYKNISVSWDQRNSNTASEFWAVDYTLDGTNWLQLAGVYDINQGSNWFDGLTADFSGISGADNNSNFGFRVLSVFAPTTTSYAPTGGSGSTYSGSTGTSRFDMVTISGTPFTPVAVPEPASVAFLGALLLGGVARSRFRAKSQLS